MAAIAHDTQDTHNTRNIPTRPEPPAAPATRRRTGWARARRYVLPLVGLAVALAFLGP